MNTPRTTQAWQALDAAHHLHPFSDAHSLNQLGSRVVVRGEGLSGLEEKALRKAQARAGEA